MKFTLLFSLLLLCFSASAQTHSDGNISIKGGVINFAPHRNASQPIRVKYTNSWSPKGKSFTLYSYKQVVILKKTWYGSFELEPFKEAFVAACEDYMETAEGK